MINSIRTVVFPLVHLSNHLYSSFTSSPSASLPHHSIITPPTCLPLANISSVFSPLFACPFFSSALFSTLIFFFFFSFYSSSFPLPGSFLSPPLPFVLHLLPLLLPAIKLSIVRVRFIVFRFLIAMHILTCPPWLASERDVEECFVTLVVLPVV